MEEIDFLEFSNNSIQCIMRVDDMDNLSRYGIAHTIEHTFYNRQAIRNLLGITLEVGNKPVVIGKFLIVIGVTGGPNTMEFYNHNLWDEELKPRLRLIFSSMSEEEFYGFFLGFKARLKKYKFATDDKVALRKVG